MPCPCSSFSTSNPLSSVPTSSTEPKKPWRYAVLNSPTASTVCVPAGGVAHHQYDLCPLYGVGRSTPYRSIAPASPPCQTVSSGGMRHVAGCQRLAVRFSQHPNEHRSKGPVLLAVDRQLGEGATLRVAPELSDPVGSLEVREPSCHPLARCWLARPRLLEAGRSLLQRSRTFES